MNKDIHKVLKESSDTEFFDNLEKCLGFGIPTNIRKILQFNYYNNAKSLSKFDDKTIGEIEEVMRYTFNVDMIGDDECITDYLCRFAKNQTDFQLIGGQKKIINIIVEYCRKVYDEPSTTSEDSEPDNIVVYQTEGTSEDKESKSLFNIIGSYMIEIYNDAKRMTLSAWSWPSRQVAHAMATNFKTAGCPSTECTLQYLTPTNHEAFLDSIVKIDLENIRRIINESLAISIRLDGSVDRTQQHNIYTMIQIVKKDATTSTLFLGFAVPEKGDAEHYFECLKNVPNNIYPWTDLFPLISSAVTDGEYLNSGHIKGLCTRLQQERSNSLQVHKLSFFWVWCIAHRVNLAWKTTSLLNIIDTTIRLCRNLSTHFHKSGARTLKLQQIAAKNKFDAPLRYPRYFPVRWVQYVHSLLTATLRNWRASIKYFKREKLTHILSKWIIYGRLHLITFLTDVLFLVKNFQKSCQSDSISILELLPMQQQLFEKLETLKHRCAEGGWEELFVENIIHSGGKIYFYGFELKRAANPSRRTRRRPVRQSLFTCTQRKHIIDLLVDKLKLRLGLDSSLCATFKPLDKIIPSTTDEDLKRCYLQILPDMNESQFHEEYFVAAESLKNHEFKTPLHTLKKLNELLPDQLLTVKTALARVAAAKPNSADVERLIYVYNKFKDVDRASLSPTTLYNYLYVNTNMPPLAAFDPTPAVNHWMAQKNRIPRSSPQAKKQEWFKGVFEEASIPKIVERQLKIQF